MLLSSRARFVLWSNYIKAYTDTAISNDEFVLYLQPKFDSTQDRIKGAEALCRWNYKKKELLSPAKFIPFFEKDGSVGKIDDIVLRKVCEALQKWKKEGKPLYPVSVNLSRIRLYDNAIIAEGAETKEQVERLGGLGCSTIQGYYYSKPITVEDYEQKYL